MASYQKAVSGRNDELTVLLNLYKINNVLSSNVVFSELPVSHASKSENKFPHPLSCLSVQLKTDGLRGQGRYSYMK